MQRSVVLGCSLLIFLTGLYLLTYRGHPVATDEMILFDMTESLARRGNLQTTEMYSLTDLWNLEGDPFQTYADHYEPLQPLLAAPLYLIANRLPDIGMMHTVWLLNIPITALTALLLYWIGLRWGYSSTVAGTGAIIFGVATMAWVYSRYFWREPLVALFILACFGITLHLQQMWQQKIPRRTLIGLVGAFIFAFVGAFLAKAIAVLILPNLIIMLLPPKNIFREQRSTILRFALVGGVVLAIILVIMNLDFGSGANRYSVSRWRELLDNVDWGYVAKSLIAYQISPGRSIWLYSPALLLGIGGAMILWRKNQWRLVVGLLISILIFSISYGISRQALWWGGNGWGPRYLLPLIPAMMLLVLPALEWLMQAGRNIAWKIGAGLLVLISIAIQILGTTVDQWDYYDLLVENNILPWEEGLWSIKWSPIVRYLELWNFDRLDMAWDYATPNWQAPVLALGLMLWAVLCGIVFARTRNLKLILPIILIIALLLTGGTTYSWLDTLQDDSRYTLNRPDIAALLTYLENNSTAEDAVLLENPDYQLPFMNSLKTPGIFMTLPYAPGEIRNPTVEPAVVSDDPGLQAGYRAAYAMQWVAQHYERLWLIMSYGPFVTFALRPQERWLAENYFRVETIETSPNARAIRFHPTPSPGGAPANITPYYFNEELLLVGYDLPDGDTYTQGDVIPISLLWQPLKPLPQDYFVSVRFLKADGFLVTQQDGAPQGTFGRMSTWLPEQFYRDNHGIQIPQYTPPGEYVLEVVVYTWPDNTRLPVVTETGSTDVVQVARVQVR
jgi:hypothetical protein